MNHPNAEVVKGTILIADDDRINQQLMSYQLSELQYKLLFASNGKEALNQYTENKDIKLVLMDVKMPEMDGVEATLKILELDPAARIIALSAFSRDESDFDADEIGFVDYVSKPIRKEMLLKTITRYL